MYIWPKVHFPENLFSRIYTCLNVHLAETTFPRKLIFQNLHLPDIWPKLKLFSTLAFTFGRNYISPKTYFHLHLPETFGRTLLFSRIFTKQNLRLVENTFPRKLIFQKLHLHKNSFSRNYFSFEILFYV